MLFRSGQGPVLGSGAAEWSPHQSTHSSPKAATTVEEEEEEEEEEDDDGDDGDDDEEEDKKNQRKGEIIFTKRSADSSNLIYLKQNKHKVPGNHYLSKLYIQLLVRLQDK